MKIGRVAFFRLVTTAAAIALISLAILTAGGRSRLGSFSSDISGNPVVDFLRHLPPTVELIAVSFLAASIVGLGVVLLFRQRLKPLTTAIAVVLRATPYFALALAMPIVGYIARLPNAGLSSTNQFMLGDHLLHLILPVGALTLFQLPPIMEYFNGRFARGLSLRAAGASTLSGLGTQFALILPDVVAATMFTEIVFAWPGEGRLFIVVVNLGRLNATGFQLVVFLSLMALFILAARFMVNIVCRADEASGADV